MRRRVPRRDRPHPDPEEIRDFERTPSANKRSLLITRLLTAKKYEISDLEGGRFKKLKPRDYATEYAENWANIWTVWLMTRSGQRPIYREQMRDWLGGAVRQERLAQGRWSRSC